MNNKPLSRDVAPEGIDPIVWRTATKSMYPGISPETIAMAIDLCKKDNVDIRMKTLHIINRGGVEKIEPSVAHYRILAKRTGRHIRTEVTEWGPLLDVRGIKTPEFCTITIWEWNPHTKQPEPWPHTEWFSERDTQSPLWKKSPRGMLQVRTESLALRKVFPDELGGLYTFEEMEDSSEPSERPSKEIRHEPLSISNSPKADVIDWTNASKKVIQNNAPREEEIALIESISRVEPVLPLSEGKKIIKEALLKEEDTLIYKDPLTDEEKSLSIQEFGFFIRDILVGIDSSSKYNLYKDIQLANKESLNAFSKRDPIQTLVLKKLIKEKREAYDTNL